jgi:hypothetical protein
MKDRQKLKEKIVDIMMQFWTDDEPDYDRTHRYAELILKEIEKESAQHDKHDELDHETDHKL